MPLSNDVPVYRFGAGMQPLEADPLVLGNKGAGLVRMAQLGLPVPPGFIVGTATGRRIDKEGAAFRRLVARAVRIALMTLERETGRGFGNPEHPFLVSVRSGAAISMPGMMDTVLNVGLNASTVEGLARETGDARFAWDTYRRFIQSYATVVLDLDPMLFEDVMELARERHAVEADADLPAEVLRELTEAFREIVTAETGEPFPEDVEAQLEAALVAVFESWNSDAARRFRSLQKELGQDAAAGTAAVVQAMVFGNRDQRSCTGVYNTRNPSTGANEPWGEYLPIAQGEDVVGGVHSSKELTEAARMAAFSENVSFEAGFPAAYAELVALGRRLERQAGVVQEVEFTVESDRLFVLQTRAAKVQPSCLPTITVDMVEEGLIDRAAALDLCGDGVLQPLLIGHVADGAERPVARGLAAVAGVVAGPIVFTSDAAVAAREAGKPAILVRPGTNPEDVHGMDAALGILTSRGGMTSHAAVVARGMGKPCITAAMSLDIDVEAATFTVLGQTFAAGDTITIDGSSGFIYPGSQPVVTPSPGGAVATLLAWRREAGLPAP